MNRELHVYVDVEGASVRAGTLWSRVRGGRESASFEYDSGWRRDPRGFELDPVSLPLGAGTFHTSERIPLFSGFADGAPDRWGRMLLRRAGRRLATPPRTLFEVDFLTLVDDEARQGAYRYRDPSGGAFLAPPGPQRIPPLVDLPRLLGAARRVLEGTEADEDLRILLAPGSSLGGARPKASVRDIDGTLLIAKFPRPDDDLPVNELEHIAMRLALRAGIRVAESRLESVAGAPVLLHRRFDRRGSDRVPFVSALTMLGAADNESHSYLEIADAIRQTGAAVRADLQELWRRLVFNVLIANTDDHLRNHGFLRVGPGWRLSPAYDINPTPTDLKPRILTLAIDETDPTGSLELALSVAGYFDLRPAEAHRIVEEVRAAVSSWTGEAKAAGLSAAQIARVASAFLAAE